MPANPEKSFNRVVSIASSDGWCVTLIAGLSTVISLAAFSWTGIAVGAVVTFAGITTLRGRRRLLDGNAIGLTWLVRAQLIIIAAIWVYSFGNLVFINEAGSLAQFSQLASVMGTDTETLRTAIKPLIYITYLTVAGVTLLFQGGLALYYYSRRDAVAKAIAIRNRTAPPSLPPLR